MHSGGEKDVFLIPVLTGLLLHASDGNVLRHVSGVLKTFPGVMMTSCPPLQSSESGDGDRELSLVFISALNSFRRRVELERRLGSS